LCSDICDVESLLRNIASLKADIKRAFKGKNISGEIRDGMEGYAAHGKTHCQRAQELLDVLDQCFGPYPPEQQAALDALRLAVNLFCKLPPPIRVPAPSTPSPVPSPGVATATKVAFGVTTGYLIYRGIRMIPSVAIPPLWPTIPANAVFP